MTLRFLPLLVALLALFSKANPQYIDTTPPRMQPGGFLYLEDHRVRFEILVPLRVLGSIYPVEEAAWTPELQAAHKAPLAILLESHMNLAINGREAIPDQSNLVFIDVRAPMESTVSSSSILDLENGAVGIIQHYTTPSAHAYEVDAAWTGFNPVIQQLPVRIISRSQDEATILTARQNRLLTHHQPSTSSNIHDQPIQSLPRDTAEASDALLANLRNIYGAFDYARDEDIYDALERTVTGELLTRIYLDIRQSLYMEQEGGATARVEEIRIVDLDLLGSTSTSTDVRATWLITGSLEHWGHIHQRTNEYTARIGMRMDAGRVKMASLMIERHQRLADEYSERNVAP